VFPESLDAVPFADRKAGNYRLTAGIKHLKAPGVDAAALCAALRPQDARNQVICTAPTAGAPGGRTLASH
jgi:hypothetical protein